MRTSSKEEQQNKKSATLRILKFRQFEANKYKVFRHHSNTHNLMALQASRWCEREGGRSLFNPLFRRRPWRCQPSVRCQINEQESQMWQWPLHRLLPGLVIVQRTKQMGLPRWFHTPRWVSDVDFSTSLKTEAEHLAVERRPCLASTKVLVGQ